MSYIYKVGVVGAGAMGAGIAQVVTYAGIPCVLRDTTKELVDRGLATIRGIYGDRVKKGKMTPEQLEQKMMLVSGSTDLKDFGDVDLAIEAVFEDLEVKKQVFADLGRACPPSAILASNTSALPISAMGEASGRPDRVAGLHFFYPAPVMKLVEVIPTAKTSTETVDTLVSFCESIRKMAVRVKECAGFLVNRILMPYIGEAIWALEEGAGSMKQIDEAMVKFGMPMGPFLLADTLGIDVCFKVALILEKAYGTRAKAPATLKAVYDAKRYGRKSGAGFYSYSDQPEWSAAPAKGGFVAERILYAMVNEAAFCVEDGVASASDVDLAMLAGTGFPPMTGGLLHWADQVGLDAVLARLKEWEKGAPRFKACALLETKVKAGEVGQKARRGFFDYT
jgi:3-hydroxyacyl-CoA dehydrogenase